SDALEDHSRLRKRRIIAEVVEKERYGEPRALPSLSTFDFREMRIGVGQGDRNPWAAIHALVGRGLNIERAGLQYARRVGQTVQRDGMGAPVFRICIGQDTIEQD